MSKITDIQEQKRNKSRSNIYVDGEYFAGASNFAIRVHRLEIGKEVNKEQLEKVLFEDTLEKAKGYIVDYHLNKSKKMIQDKLKEKGYEESVIEKVMEFIEKYKLVNDLEYARRKSSDALRIGKKGKRVISQTLKQNGISEEDIEHTLGQITDEEQIEIAKKALRGKVDTYRRKAKDKYDFKSKCYAFLTRRGFTSDIITIVLEEINGEENQDEL